MSSDDLLAIGLSQLEPTSQHPEDPDLLLARWGKNFFRVAVERARLRGREELESRLARGAARLAALARDRKSHPGALVVIRAPSLSPRTEEALDRFCSEVLSEGAWNRDLEWVITDSRVVLGPARLRMEGSTARRIIGAPVRRRRRVDSGFSDSFLCMTKAVAFAQLEPRWIPGSTRLRMPGGSITDADQLAHAAQVSLPQVHRFVRTAREAGHLLVGPKGLRLRSFDTLAAQWAQRIDRHRRSAICAAVQEPDVATWIARHKERFRLERDDDRNPPRTGAALGLHEAAERWGLKEVTGAPLTVYVFGDLDQAVVDLGLEVATGDSFDLWLLNPRFPRALALGLSDPGGRGVQAIDIVQCYLDALADPVRGSDAAARIRTALGPLFGPSET